MMYVYDPMWMYSIHTSYIMLAWYIGDSNFSPQSINWARACWCYNYLHLLFSSVIYIQMIANVYHFESFTRSWRQTFALLIIISTRGLSTLRRHAHLNKRVYASTFPPIILFKLWYVFNELTSSYDLKLITVVVINEDIGVSNNITQSRAPFNHANN